MGVKELHLEAGAACTAFYFICIHVIGHITIQPVTRPYPYEKFGLK